MLRVRDEQMNSLLRQSSDRGGKRSYTGMKLRGCACRSTTTPGISCACVCVCGLTVSYF